MCNTERFFVVSDNHRESLDRVVCALSDPKERILFRVTLMLLNNWEVSDVQVFGGEMPSL